MSKKKLEQDKGNICHPSITNLFQKPNARQLTLSEMLLHEKESRTRRPPQAAHQDVDPQESSAEEILQQSTLNAAEGILQLSTSADEDICSTESHSWLFRQDLFSTNFFATKKSESSSEQFSSSSTSPNPDEG